MTNNLFNMLIDFLETTFNQEDEHQNENDLDIEPQYNKCLQQNYHSSRIFSYWEQFKLTKASYQLIMRLMKFDVISTDIMEHIINQLTFSESQFVSLEETKWVIRDTLENHLDSKQLAFLDLVLSQDAVPVH